MCREVGGLTNWVEVRDAVDAQLAKMANQIAGPGAINPDTWGLEPEHVDGQDRAMGRGVYGGDR